MLKGEISWGFLLLLLLLVMVKVWIQKFGLKNVDSKQILFPKENLVQNKFCVPRTNVKWTYISWKIVPRAYYS